VLIGIYLFKLIFTMKLHLTSESKKFLPRVKRSFCLAPHSRTSKSVQFLISFECLYSAK